MKDDHDESAYVPSEQQPDYFLISVLWAGKGKSKKEEEWIDDGGDVEVERCD